MPDRSELLKSSMLFEGKLGAELRQAQATIARLAARPIPLPGIPGTLFDRAKKNDKDQKSPVAVPAIVGSPARLFAHEDSAPSTAEHIADAARRARESIESGDYGSARSAMRLLERSLGEDASGVRADIQERVLLMLEDLPRRAPIWSFGRNPAETTTHDYSVFRMMQEPSVIDGMGLSSVKLETFLRSARELIEDVIVALPPMRSKFTPRYGLQGEDTEYTEAIVVFEGWQETRVVDTHTAHLLADYFFQLFLTYLADTLYALDRRLPLESGVSIVYVFREWFMKLYAEHGWNADSVLKSADAPSFWEKGSDEILALFQESYSNVKFLTADDLEGTGYSFVPFSSRSVGFGLQLTYRQHWRLRQLRPAEIVKTIPLGPRQVEKVYTKVVRTSRQLSSRETLTSMESNGESTNTNRSTHEIVAESAVRTQLQAGLELSVPVDMIEIGGNGSVNVDTSSNSRDTKSQLNESVERTARKLRNEVKISVSTEQSSTTEMSTATELVNPNDEIPITYVYSRLQSEYAVSTRLAEVASVVFVPERVPGAEEINEAWIREHDWILARHLLDESFREDLTLVSSGNLNSVDDTEDAVMDWFKSSGEAARDALKDYKSFQGGNIADVFSGIHESYERQLERVREERRRLSRFQRVLERLCGHLRQNILHYMRAIWSAEDPEQRYLRYRSRFVTVATKFVPSISIDVSRWTKGVRGRFLPSLNPKDRRRLADILDLSGPIGFLGNCAVYRLRSDAPSFARHESLAAFRSAYLEFEWEGWVTQADAGGSEVYHVAALRPRFRVARYQLTKLDDDAAWKATLTATGEEVSVRIARGGKALHVDGLYVQFSAKPGKDFSTELSIRATDAAQDPEVRMAPLEHSLPAANEEAAFWTEPLLKTMVQHLADLAALWAEGDARTWDNLSKAAKQEVRNCYYDYLVRSRHTRQVVVDGENLVLDLDVGSTVALEEFKRLHRAVDVLKELENWSRLEAENDRRRRRMDNGELSDPDIEQLNLTRIEIGSGEDGVGAEEDDE